MVTPNEAICRRLQMQLLNFQDDETALRRRADLRRDAASVTRWKLILVASEAFELFEPSLQSFLLAFVDCTENARGSILRYFEGLSRREDVSIPFESIGAARPLNLGALPTDLRLIAANWERVPADVAEILRLFNEGGRA